MEEAAMIELTWGTPQWLWALAVLPLLIGLFAWAEQRRAVLLRKLVAARLQPVLAGNISATKRRLKFALTAAALAFLVLALASPRHGYLFEKAQRKGRDVLIAVDTSRSMLATDVAPNRLSRAKLAAQDLINALEADRAGLIAFAGSAFLQAPLTVDYSAVLNSLNELDTNIVPRGGTNIAEAIRTAKTAFGRGEGDSRCLVLFTDGEELEEDAVAAARDAAGTMKIFTVGVGSADGSLIPVPGENGGTEFVKDPEGNFVKSRLDEAKLKEIAQMTGGFYIRLQNGPSDMRRIVEAGVAKLKESEFDERMSRRPIERYQWPLGASLLLLAASVLVKERRKVQKPANGASSKRAAVASQSAVALALLSALCHPAPMAAAGTPSGEELYQQGKYDEAGKQFDAELRKRPDSPALQFNKGTADYGLGQYTDAVDEFGKALESGDPKLRAKAEYNLGTALLQRAIKRDETKQESERKGDLTNAVQHLDEALKLNPKDKDAEYNRGIAHYELTKPKPTPPPSNKDQKKDDKQDQSKDQQSKDQQSKDQQSKDQQSKDQQSKDQQSKDQQSKDQQSKDQQSKDQQSKDQQSKDQQSKDQQSKDQQSKDQQSKDQQSKDQQQSQNGSEKQKDQASQGGPSPTPAPPTDERKLSGEIKPSDDKDKKAAGAEGNKAEEEAQAEAETTGSNGEMSKQQARALLDSLKDDEGHPFKNEQRSAAPVLKDW
jgi:Ca-activated chloride channel family protein